MLVLFSTASNDSGHVRNELNVAAEKDLRILPIQLDSFPISMSMRYYLGAAHWFDARTEPLEGSMPALIEAVRGVLPTLSSQSDTRQTGQSQMLSPGPESSSLHSGEVEAGTIGMKSKLRSSVIQETAQLPLIGSADLSQAGEDDVASMKTGVRPSLDLRMNRAPSSLVNSESIAELPLASVDVAIAPEFSLAAEDTAGSFDVIYRIGSKRQRGRTVCLYQDGLTVFTDEKLPNLYQGVSLSVLPQRDSRKEQIRLVGDVTRSRSIGGVDSVGGTFHVELSVRCDRGHLQRFRTLAEESNA
jgi:hypothetical protein